MRRDRSVSVFASIAGFVGVAAIAIALTGCTASECAPDEASRTVTVRTAKPGIGAVQCWSGCAPGVRDLESGANEEWTALLADDRPESVTLAARDADGGLLFGQRFHVEWSGCPAGPDPDVLELFRPEGGSQPDSSG
ncbi:MAG TPA: hypothetical protein VFE99_07400 [Agromyces sp.]|nr:hypothetical protein [Agromyces sp.]